MPVVLAIQNDISHYIERHINIIAGYIQVCDRAHSDPEAAHPHATALRGITDFLAGSAGLSDPK
jgi:hypothetical protein